MTENKDRRYSRLALAGFLISILEILMFFLYPAIIRTRPVVYMVILSYLALAVSMILPFVSFCLSLKGTVSARRKDLRGGAFGILGVILSSLEIMIVSIMFILFFVILPRMDSRDPNITIPMHTRTDISVTDTDWTFAPETSGDFKNIVDVGEMNDPLG